MTKKTEERYRNMISEINEKNQITNAFLKSNKMQSGFLTFLKNNDFIAKSRNGFVLVKKITEKDFNNLSIFLDKKRAEQAEKSLEKYRKTLEEVLKTMPVEFTGFEFYDGIRAKLNIKGGTSVPIDSNSISLFLKRETTKLSAKTYQKKERIERDLFSQEPNFTEKAIAHLKQLGYRIMKPINQWEEL